MIYCGFYSFSMVNIINTCDHLIIRIYIYFISLFPRWLYVAPLLQRSSSNIDNDSFEYFFCSRSPENDMYDSRERYQCAQIYANVNTNEHRTHITTPYMHAFNVAHTTTYDDV